MTDLPRRQRRDLRERRRARALRSAERQRQIWTERFDAAATPLELLGLNYSLLRTRLVQLEERAADAVERAGDQQTKTVALERLAAARTDVERICGETVDHLARAADQIDTTRR